MSTSESSTFTMASSSKSKSKSSRLSYMNKSVSNNTMNKLKRVIDDVDYPRPKSMDDADSILYLNTPGHGLSYNDSKRDFLSVIMDIAAERIADKPKVARAIVIENVEHKLFLIEDEGLIPASDRKRPALQSLADEVMKVIKKEGKESEMLRRHVNAAWDENHVDVAHFILREILWAFQFAHDLHKSLFRAPNLKRELLQRTSQFHAQKALDKTKLPIEIVDKIVEKPFQRVNAKREKSKKQN